MNRFNEFEWASPHSRNQALSRIAAEAIRYGVPCAEFIRANECPDSVLRHLTCTSTMAGDPSSASMTCMCRIAGTTPRMFDLAATERPRLAIQPGQGTAEVAPYFALLNANCGWSLPPP